MYESIIIKEMIIKEYINDIRMQSHQNELVNQCKDSEPLFYERILSKFGELLIRIGTRMKYHKQPDLNPGLINC